MSQNRASIRRHALLGAATAFLLIGGVGGWAATTELAGAVVAPGSLVVDGNVRKVQHPTGGVVGELNVREGDHVRSGDILIRLDETLTRANLAIVEKALVDFEARYARLEAERDDAAEILFPADLPERAADPAIARVLDGERRLLTLRRVSRDGQKAQLGERITQLNEEIEGLGGQVDAKSQELELIARELDGVRELFGKGLIPLTRLTALERDEARLHGERARLVSGAAQTRGRITEIALQILQIDQDLRSEVEREMGDVQGRIAELVERRVGAQDQLRRVDLRAPGDGVVHELAVHTVGGVVGSGETLMVIVPEDDKLAVEVRIAPNEIDRLRPGQPALLRFSAFNQRTTPQLEGTVSRISADLTTDPQTKAGFYTVRIQVSEDEISRLGEVRLVPGMPVEAFIKTDERTVFSYLVKPMSDQMLKAFRER